MTFSRTKNAGWLLFQIRCLNYCGLTTKMNLKKPERTLVLHLSATETSWTTIQRRKASLFSCCFPSSFNVSFLRSDEDTDETASSKSDLSPAKRRKLNINFFAKLQKKNSQNNTFDELDSYFKHCKNLEDLKNYPTVQKIYKLVSFSIIY